MLIDLLRSRRVWAIYYCLLTLLFFCTGAFASTVFDYYLRAYRVGALFLLMGIPLSARLYFDYKEQRGYSLPFLLAVVYALLICAIGTVHGLALSNVPSLLPLNIVGVTAAHLVRSNLGFSLFYLFFPMMLVGHFFLLKHLGLQPTIRFFALAAFLSVCVLLY